MRNQPPIPAPKRTDDRRLAWNVRRNSLHPSLVVRYEMVAIRILAVVITLIPLAALADDTPPLRVVRPEVYKGIGSSIEIFVNDVSVGRIRSGEEKIFNTDAMRIGRNKVHAVVHGDAFGKSPFWEDTTDRTFSELAYGAGDKRYFSVAGDETEIVLTIGFGERFSKRGVFSVSNEVEGGWEPPVIKSVDFDTQLKQVVIKESPVIRLAPGTEKTVEDTIKIRHEVRISSNWRVEAELRAALDAIWARVALDVKGEIEKSTNRVYSVETERSRSVLIKGDGITTVRVVWVEYFRTGTVLIKMDNQEVLVPFEFGEDFDLLTTSSD